jgi:hypothetical protein
MKRIKQLEIEVLVFGIQNTAFIKPLASSASLPTAQLPTDK